MTAYNKNQPSSIKAMFNSIANRYDFTNAVLSFYLHKLWNRQLTKRAGHPFRARHTLLDLCSGTGDIAFHYLKKRAHPCRAYLIDFSGEMLGEAKKKAEKLPLDRHDIIYIEADVQKLPLPDDYAECATMAYGIRNVKNPAQCFQELFRVLKPGGRFGILELTRPENRLLNAGHQLYLRTFLPLFGRWLTKNEGAYQYLRQSIHTFIAPKELEKLLKATGFSRTEVIKLSGGIATIIMAYKE